MKVLVSSFASWHMDHAAKAYENCNALAGLYIGNKNQRGISKGLYHRAWPFHLCMKPFYHLPPMVWQQIQYRFFMGSYNTWLKHQKFPKHDVIQAIAWGAKTPFDIAEKTGALKVLDAPNSYPTTFDAYVRREAALWSKSKITTSVPLNIIKQVVRDIDRADVILCPSAWVKDSMIANGVPESKCFVNPFGVDTYSFTPRKTIPSCPRFLCVGSICLRKGYQYLFPAFEKVKQQYPEAELFCAGSVLSDFKPLISKWNHLISHIGLLNKEALIFQLQTSTAFILPSTEEGFARAIIEGMASGLPILATYESGATTLVKDGQEGIIFQSRNVDAIAEAMLKMIEQPTLCKTMGEKSYIKGSLKNTWQNYGERNLKIFSEAIKLK